ncbi:MAG: hypothetical protein J7L96_03525 [Bacteroidales bacterium]|nr:hypothetical protein [Bacteroidales bacterium]
MKIIKDPKIEVEDGIAKIIAETICHEIKASRTGNGKIYDRARRCERQYSQITTWMEQDKVCDEPWSGAADYFVPLTEWIIDAVWSRIVNILFSEEPLMTAEGVESSDKPKEKDVTSFVNMILTETVNIYNPVSFFFKQMIKLPFAVLKYCWENEVDSVISKDTAAKFVHADGRIEYVIPSDPESMVQGEELLMNGFQVVGEEEVWTLSDKELVDNPVARYIKFDDYVWSPKAKKDNRLYWEGDRFWLTLNEIRMKAKRKEYRESAVERSAKAIDISQQTGASAVIAQREFLIESYHWYGRLPFNESNEIDFQSNDAIEQEVHCIIDMKNAELFQIEHWEYKRLPNPDRVYIHGMFEETENFEGRSLSEKLYMTQKELNHLHNTIMNNAQIAMQKIFVKKRTLTGEDWEMPEVYPGAIWEEDNTGDIRALNVGDVANISWELEASFINFAERLSNISVYQTGTARQGGQKTKGEVERTVQEGNISMDKFVKRCHEVMETLCEWTVGYYSERMPPGLERRILGEDGQKIFPTNDNMAQYEQQGVKPYWDPNDITGNFDFNWLGTSLTSNKQFQIAVQNDIEERYLPHPMVGGNMLATWEILRDGLLVRGKKDWQKYLPPREAIIQQMKLQQAQVQAQKKKDENKKKLPQQAVQKAIQKGVPPQVANQMSANMATEDTAQ